MQEPSVVRMIAPVTTDPSMFLYCLYIYNSADRATFPVVLGIEMRGLFVVKPVKFPAVILTALDVTRVPAVIEIFPDDCVKSALATSVMARTAVCATVGDPRIVTMKLMFPVNDVVLPALPIKFSLIW